MSDSTSLDPRAVESYIKNYNGFNRIFRLHYIGKTFEPLARAAFNLQLKYLIDETRDVYLYEELADRMGRESIELPMDEVNEWLVKSQNENNEILNRLDQEQMSLSANFMQRELGSVYSKMAHCYWMAGDFALAQRYLDKQRSNDQSLFSDMEFTAKLAECHFLQESWSLCRTVAFKKFSEKEATIANARLGVLSALCYLRENMHEECAGTLLKVVLVPRAATDINNEEQGAYEKITIDDSDLEAVSPAIVGITTESDLAMYITVCALASFSRQELIYLVDKDPVFRYLCECSKSCNYLITLLNSFLDLKYNMFFQLWEQNRDMLSLDMYLGPVLSGLATKIFQRAYVDYMTPYSVLDLSKMETAFGRSVIQDLPEVIRANNLDFRLDLDHYIAVRVREDQTTEIFTRAEKIAERYIVSSNTLLWSNRSLLCAE